MKHSKFLAAAMGFAIAGTLAVSAQSADMANVTIVNGTIPKSLTGKAGDPAAGKKAAINQKKGNCLACHVMPIPEEQFHGKTGPDLHGIGSRQTEAELRMRLVDPKVISADTMMPSFFKTGQHRVLKDFEGKTILEAQEVENIVAYLLTLK
ncbi:MAG: sulfur oxidation c-type cytochrome SoxX [Rhodospirillales bacterium]|nr:sulfur oxidation c-type cytochrome SoxX [Rhodospirillales bacterium]